MPQTITVTIEERHVEFLEGQAGAAGLTVDALVNNLIGLSRKTLPELALLTGYARGGSHAS